MYRRWLKTQHSHCSGQERKHVTGDPAGERQEDLKTQAKRVQRRGDICNHGQGEQNGQELPETTHRMEHGFYKPSNTSDLVTRIPLRNGGDGNSNGCAETLDQNLAATNEF